MFDFIANGPCEGPNRDLVESFLDFVRTRIEAQKSVVDIEESPMSSGFIRPDFYVIRQDRRPVIVTCCDRSGFAAVAGYSLELSKEFPDCAQLIACMDWLSENDRLLLPEGVGLWDADEIAKKYYQPRTDLGPRDTLTFHLQQQIGEGYVEALNTLPAGIECWARYEKLIPQIFAFLFHPDLELQKEQSADQNGRNRRDAIFQINRESAFWTGVAQNYAHSSYVVVEAKNGSEVGKNEVNQLADYLRPNGLGMFGILVTRNQRTESAWDAMVRCRRGDGGPPKTIITLDDTFMRRLLIARGNGNQRECEGILQDQLFELAQVI